ncbi:hypothetical protein D3C85_1777150 [compost metagenome]
MLPSSLRSNSSWAPTQMPKNGLVCVVSRTASARPCAFSSRMQSGIAPWPGNTTLSAVTTRSGSEVRKMSAPMSLTLCTDFSTECRLPMP